MDKIKDDSRKSINQQTHVLIEKGTCSCRPVQLISHPQDDDGQHVEVLVLLRQLGRVRRRGLEVLPAVVHLRHAAARLGRDAGVVLVLEHSLGVLQVPDSIIVVLGTRSIILLQPRARGRPREGLGVVGRLRALRAGKCDGGLPQRLEARGPFCPRDRLHDLVAEGWVQRPGADIPRQVVGGRAGAAVEEPS